jgi:hypothetical protein
MHVYRGWIDVPPADLRERTIGDCAVLGRQVSIPLRPWEIATIRIEA